MAGTTSGTTTQFPWVNDPNAKALNQSNPKNQKGSLGEVIAEWFFLTHNFQVNFLGEKAPDADLFVSFEDVNIYESLFQIKTTGTWAGFNDNPIPTGSVNSGLAIDKYDRLQIYHLPTYLMHIDLTNDCVMLRSVFKKEPNTKKTMITGQFSFKLSNLTQQLDIAKGLVADIKKYWDNGMINDYKDSVNSYFE